MYALCVIKLRADRPHKATDILYHCVSDIKALTAAHNRCISVALCCLPAVSLNYKVYK